MIKNREDSSGAIKYYYGKMGEVWKTVRTLIVPNQAKDKRLKCMICSLCVILIIFSCADKKNRYGINFNNQRSIIKLPLLDSSWKYSPSYTSEGGAWVNPQKKDGVPCYFQKRNLIKNNRLIWESDIYLGGKTYMTIDGSIRESLTVTYYFEKKKWEYVYHTAKRNYNSSNSPSQIKKIYNSIDVVISKSEADSILFSWGL